MILFFSTAALRRDAYFHYPLYTLQLHKKSFGAQCLYNNMMQGTSSIDAGFAWHIIWIALYYFFVNQ